MLQMQLDNAVVPLWAAQTLMMRRWKEVCIQPRPWGPAAVAQEAQTEALFVSCAADLCRPVCPRFPPFCPSGGGSPGLSLVCPLKDSETSEDIVYPDVFCHSVRLLLNQLVWFPG